MRGQTVTGGSVGRLLRGHTAMGSVRDERGRRNRNRLYDGI